MSHYTVCKLRHYDVVLVVLIYEENEMFHAKTKHANKNP